MSGAGASPSTGGLSRRAFLAIGAAAGGGLLVAFNLPRLPGLDPRGPDEPAVPHRFDAFLVLDTDGVATVTIPVPEIGQGVRTALAMLVAEELEIPWDRVRVTQADAADDLGPSPMAGGSQAVRAYWKPLREAGAAARAALVSAAAERWGVVPADCRAAAGVVRSGRHGAAYGDLAGDAARLAQAAASAERPAEPPALKPAAEHRLIGTPTPHLDAPAIVTGAIGFGLDVRVPGLLRAVVARPPVYGGGVRGYDASLALAVPGVVRVLELAPVGEPERPTVQGGVAVLASDTWAALRGRDALRVDWEEGPNAAESTDRLHEACRALVARRAPTWREAGDVDAAIRGAHRTVEALYHVPFLAHAPMEPMSCTVHVRDDGCEIWAPTQIPVPTRAVAARRLDIPPERVTVHVTRIGGGFGRRLDVDFMLEALELSREVGAPVQVVWTREDDTRHGFLRPFSWHRLAAGLDAAGRVTGWLHRQAGTSRYAFREGANPAHSEFRAGTWPAALAPAHRLEYALAESNLPRGPLRAPGLNAFTFAAESFLDEAARAAGRDPLELRLELLGADRELPYGDDDPVFDTGRMRRVLETAAARAGWGRPLPDGRGRGIAATFTFGTYLAHVAEVAVDRETGVVRVERVVSAIDCGRVVNPNGVRAQVEGGFMDGLGATLHGEITVEGGRIVQSNFHDFPLLRLDEAPDVQVHILGSDAPPTGVGEPPYPPVPAAVANAVADAVGARVRELPLRPERVRAALAAT